MLIDQDCANVQIVSILHFYEVIETKNVSML